MDYSSNQMRKMIVRSHPFNEYWTTTEFRTAIAITDMLGDEGERTFVNETEFSTWANRVIDWYDLEDDIEGSPVKYVRGMLEDMEGRYLAELSTIEGFMFLKVRLIGGTPEVLK